jgi:hypothetical protein
MAEMNPRVLITPKRYWRVMHSSKWNQKKYEQNWRNLSETRRLPQSMGKKPPKIPPKRGDVVYFVFKRKIVMKGKVCSNVEIGNYHQIHSCNIGTNRPHSEPSEFIWINITEVGLSENVRKTGQRTWVKWNEDMPTELTV